MKIILLGNAGSGKTTLARHLAARHALALLALDDIAFAGGTERRPPADSVADARRFIARHAHWVIEGCYADLIEPLLPDADTLIFLNPGVDACIALCRARPWEPDKFASRAEQDAHLDNLLSWVRQYDTRADEYGLDRHRALFSAFRGEKVEYTDVTAYDLQPPA